MAKGISGKIGIASLTLAGVFAGLGLPAAEEIAPDPALGLEVRPPEPPPVTLSKPTTVASEVKPMVTPVTLKNVLHADGVSLDGAWLLYTVPSDDDKIAPMICARNLKTQEQKELGRVEWQGGARPKNPDYGMMLPRTASADLKQVWLSACKDRLWRWEPASGKLTACSTPTNTSMETELVAGRSADGQHWAVIENRRHLLVIESATGKIVEQVPRPGKDSHLDEVHWAGNRLILTSPYSLGSGDLIQLWPKNDNARWKPLLKNGESKVMWVGAQGEMAVVRTGTRLCRWSPEAPDKLEELAVLEPDQNVLLEPTQGRLVLTRVVKPAPGAPAGAGAEAAAAQEPHLEVTVLEPDGKPVLKEPLRISLAKAVTPVEQIAAEKKRKDAEYFTAQLRVLPLVARGDRMLIRLQRENRYGVYGNVFEMVALVEFGATPQVTAVPQPLLQWVSSGMQDEHLPIFQTLPLQGTCVAQQDRSLHIFRLP